jgi:hypothetical protein
MVIFAGHGPNGAAPSLISAVSWPAVRLGLRTLRDPCSLRNHEISPSGDLSIFAFEVVALRLANFANGNKRQHGKDRKSYQHRDAPSTSRDRKATTGAFGAQKVPIGLEV